MFIGQITDMEVLDDTPSVTYEYYQNVIKPKPQPKAEAVGTTKDGQTDGREIVCLCVGQNPFGRLFRIAGAERKPGMNVQIVVKYVTHDDSSFLYNDVMQ